MLSWNGGAFETALLVGGLSASAVALFRTHSLAQRPREARPASLPSFLLPGCTGDEIARASEGQLGARGKAP
ncbi:hypothetical protein [Geothrix sp. 21YS21S-4]|uniref:hypothetical protein n=1 Tax=Geothrix sp. 21YS21S-4 TaxID=3068889 RepID=UPI0027B8F0C8|nr:hypothetical protein [Geothrix sp. 21YS21S-4]